jgi:hypothetical protein
MSDTILRSNMMTFMLKTWHRVYNFHKKGSLNSAHVIWMWDAGWWGRTGRGGGSRPGLPITI